MMRNAKTRANPYRHGFTIVEILIVVIILGILAAIVIPQFTDASVDARRSSLEAQLQSLQQQVAFYKLQHNDANPPLMTTGWTVFTEFTDINGKVSPTLDATHIYGPYCQTAPVNPFTAQPNASVIAKDPGNKPGWIYNETTGKIYATGADSSNYFNPQDGSNSATAPY